MPNLTPDLDSNELNEILAQSERAASQPLGSSLLERLGGPEKAQELVEKLRTSSPSFKTTVPSENNSTVNNKQITEEQIVADANKAPVRPEYKNFLKQRKRDWNPPAAHSPDYTPENLALEDLNKFDKLTGMSSGERSGLDDWSLSSLKKIAYPTENYNPPSSLKSENKIPGTELMERQNSSPLYPQNTEGSIVLDALRSSSPEIKESDSDRALAALKTPSASVSFEPLVKPSIGSVQPTSAEGSKQDREDELTKVIGKEESRKVGEYEDLMRRYQESQDRANQMRMMAGIGEGAELLGASIAGVKPADASFYRQIAERADLLPKQFKEAEDFKKEARRNDPNSEESRSARNFAKGLGYPVGESESAAELEKRFPIMERFQTAKENREARKETLALEKLRIDSEKEKSRQAKFTSDQNNFLDRERSRFAKDKVHEAAFILKDALRAVDNYLRNPDPTAAQSLAYAFAKVNDPNSVVRESELKLFGKAGSLFDRFKQTIEMATKGQIPEKKALEFKNFISGKIQSAENDLKTKLSPIVEGGKRRGLEAQDVIESVAGPEYYQNLYSESGASAVKQTRQFDKKMTGMAGRTFTDNKTGKTYKVNLDETSATEI